MKWLSPLPIMAFVSHVSMWGITNKNLSYYSVLIEKHQSKPEMGMVLNIFYKLWLQRTPQQTFHITDITFAPGTAHNYQKILIHPVLREHWPDYVDIAWVLYWSSKNAYSLDYQSPIWGFSFFQVSQFSLGTIKRSIKKHPSCWNMLLRKHMVVRKIWAIKPPINYTILDQLLNVSKLCVPHSPYFATNMVTLVLIFKIVFKIRSYVCQS